MRRLFREAVFASALELLACGGGDAFCRVGPDLRLVSGDRAFGGGVTIDLGAAPAGTTATFPRTLTNAGPGTLHATAVRLADGVFSTSLQAPFELGSGETRAFELRAPLGDAGTSVRDVLVIEGLLDAGCPEPVVRFELQAHAE